MRPAHLLVPVMGMLALQACSPRADDQDRTSRDANLRAAEAFVDAFYSFDRDRLRAVLSSAEGSQPQILFYQGWAQGGNYKILNRMPSTVDDASKVRCSITVNDDLINALGFDFNVTDTFHIILSEGKIVSVETSSDDPPEYAQAEDWVNRNRPEVVKEPCRGYFEGGPTPGDCVRGMVQGFAEFAASADFPQQPTSASPITRPARQALHQRPQHPRRCGAARSVRPIASGSRGPQLATARIWLPRRRARCTMLPQAT